MNFLNKILLAVFLLLFYFFVGGWGRAYSADHLILQDLDTQNNLATICQDGGSLCSDIEVVSFDDLEREQKDQVIEMITSSSMSMNGYSYNATLELDQFSNFLSHSDEISYSHDLSNSLETAKAVVAISTGIFFANIALLRLFPKMDKSIAVFSGLGNMMGGLIIIFNFAVYYLDQESN